MRFSTALVVALLLTGCASSHVLVGQARPAIPAEEVRIYLEPPAHYETIALLEASNRGKMNFTDQGRTNTVIWRLKEEAAALGANGVLLQGMGSQYAGSVGTANAWASGNSAYGIGVSSAVMNRVGNGLAIYVPVGSQAAVAAAEPAAAPGAAPGVAPATAVDAADAGGPPEGTAPPAHESFEPDPAKRCVACDRLRVR